MEDANPVAESETEELETSVEPQQDAETAAEGGNTGSTEDATPGKEVRESEGSGPLIAREHSSSTVLLRTNSLPFHVNSVRSNLCACASAVGTSSIWLVWCGRKNYHPVRRSRNDPVHTAWSSSSVPTYDRSDMRT